MVWMVNGLSKIISLILLTSFVIRILWLFYEMQLLLLLPGMSTVNIQYKHRNDKLCRIQRVEDDTLESMLICSSCRECGGGVL